jgi:hypothetical protein
MVVYSVWLRSYPQTLEKAGSPAMHKHSCLLLTFVNYGRKKFYTIGSSSAPTASASFSDLMEKLLKHSLVYPGNTKEGSITVPLTSCLTGLD